MQDHLIGDGKHHMELGGGICCGFYSCKYRNKRGHQAEHDKTGPFGFPGIGHRYQAHIGITIRVGLSPGVALGGHDRLPKNNHGINRAAPICPYLPLGYSF